jgi:hypothetical protein
MNVILISWQVLNQHLLLLVHFLDLHLHIIPHQGLFQDFALVVGDDSLDIFQFFPFENKLEALPGR